MHKEEITLKSIEKFRPPEKISMETRNGLRKIFAQLKETGGGDA